LSFDGYTAVDLEFFLASSKKGNFLLAQRPKDGCVANERRVFLASELMECVGFQTNYRWYEARERNLWCNRDFHVFIFFGFRTV
jgi:hypothetical protein